MKSWRLKQAGRRLGTVCLLAAVSCLGSPDDPALPQPYSSSKSLGRHQKIQQRISDADRADVLFLGDSITHYWETRGAAVWKEAFGGLRVLNLGVEGDRTWNLLWRLSQYDLEALHPKAVVLLIGTNNIGLSKQPGSSAVAGVEAVVQALRQSLPEVPVVLMGLFPRGGAHGWLQKQVNIANEKIKTLHEDERVVYLDIGERFLKPDGEIDTGLMHDRLHLTEAGYRVWAEALLPELNRIMNEGGESHE